ncbi:hypothetical protein DFH09DRAFT_1089055 [Mycena vulgaris]|nr:hypothetical protein DFH09DRAFT_1089055 [Mycena vulgaris]
MEEEDMIRGGSDQHFACAACGNPVSPAHNVGKGFGRVSAEAAEHPRVGPRYCGGFENLNPDLDPADPRGQIREWTRYPCGTLPSSSSSEGENHQDKLKLPTASEASHDSYGFHLECYDPTMIPFFLLPPLSRPRPALRVRRGEYATSGADP